LTADSSPRTNRRGGKSPLLGESRPREQETAFDEPESTYPDDSMNMIDDQAIDIDEITNAYTNGDPGDSFDAMGDDPLSDPPIENIDPMGNNAIVISDEDEAVAGLEEDDEAQEESYEEEAVEVEQDEEPQEVVAQSQPKASRRKPKRTLFSNARNRGQKRKSPSAEPESSAIATERGEGKGKPVSQDVDDSQLSIGQRKRGRGRPKTKKESVVYQDSDSDNPPQAKKAKRGPKPKDPNAKLSARQSKEVEELIEKIKDRPRRPHNLYILRRETPADDTVTHTRSGRTSVRPLAYWRNERCVYGNGEAAEGERFPLATIQEVIRNDEVEIPGNKRGKAKGKRRRARQESEDEEDDKELDIWEEEPGIMSQDVLRWDSQLQEAIDVSETVGRFALSCAISLLMYVRCCILPSSY
jgi:centromere protein C